MNIVVYFLNYSIIDDGVKNILSLFYWNINIQIEFKILWLKFCREYNADYPYTVVYLVCFFLQITNVHKIGTTLLHHNYFCDFKLI